MRILCQIQGESVISFADTLTRYVLYLNYHFKNKVSSWKETDIRTEEFITFLIIKKETFNETVEMNENKILYIILSSDRETEYIKKNSLPKNCGTQIPYFV